MDSKRSIGIVLIVIGVTVAVHTIVEPLYHVSSEGHPYSPLWNLLDPLMGPAIVLGLIVGYPRMQRAISAGPDAPVTWERLAATTMFYGFLGVGILILLELVQHHVDQRRLRPRQERERERCGLDDHRYLAAAIFGRNRRIPSP